MDAADVDYLDDDHAAVIVDSTTLAACASVGRCARVTWAARLLVAGLWFSSAEAVAQELPAEAAERQGQGEVFFEAENYEAALVEFERVYELLDGNAYRYFVLYNIGQCHERLFRYDRALEYYQRYLDEGGPDAADRGTVEGMIHALEGLLGTVTVAVNVPSAELWIDDHLVGDAPGTFRVPSGIHVVEVRAAGFSPARTEATVAARREASVALTLEALGADHGLHPALFISGAVLTLGALGVGIGYGVEMLNAQSAGEALAGSPGGTRFGFWAGDNDHIRELGLIADVMYGVAGGLAIGSFVLALFTDWGGGGSDDAAAATVVAVVPWIGPDPGLSIAGRL